MSPSTNPGGEIATIQSEITRLAADLGACLLAQGLQVTTAESCTAGGIAEAITRIAGSSRWFGQGWVTYSNAAKSSQLGVNSFTLKRLGAVCEPVVLAMAEGARERAGADWAVAVSGIAGPDGGSPEKPVGLVWFAWAGPAGCEAASVVFPGDREAVRAQTVRHALSGLFSRVTAGEPETPVP